MQTVDFSDVRGKHLLAAVSGGADSVALLRLLYEASGEYALTLTAAHVEHGLRGTQSKADMEFVTGLCASLGIPLMIRRVRVQDEPDGTETAARRLRYAALEEMCADCGADLIALAHHRDDQAETILMHLFRGSGLQGVRGMRRLDHTLYRPLLNVPKAELEAYLRLKGIPWCTDSTNLTPDNPRNMLRLEVFPKLREFYPGFETALIRFAETAGAEDDLLGALAGSYRFETGPYGARLSFPERLSPALRKRVLYRQLGEAATYDRIDLLNELCEAKRGKRSITKDILAVRTPAALYLVPAQRKELPETPLCLNGVTDLGDYGYITAMPCMPVPLRDDPYTQVLDADKLKGCTVRTRRNGDRMRPLGCGEKLVSDILTDRKIDAPLRDAIPLVTRGSNILWLTGICISGDAAVTEDTSHAVRLEYKND